MARFSGKVGYATSQETPSGSGVWESLITERQYYGDVIRDSRRQDSGEKVNEDVALGNSISVVADMYARNFFDKIKYVIWKNIPWTVTSVEFKEARLILSIGEVYNGPMTT